MRPLQTGITLLSLLVLAPAIHATELASWTAGEPGKGSGMALTRAPASDWQPVPSPTLPVVRLTPVNDYFKRASFVFRLDRAIPGSSWLTVGFLDRGYGVITPALGQEGRGISQRDSRGAKKVLAVAGERLPEPQEVVETFPLRTAPSF